MIRGRAVLVAGEPVVDILAQLGYPAYLAHDRRNLEAPRRYRLGRPWLSAAEGVGLCGNLFEMIGAAASWIATGDKTGQFIAPPFFAVIAMGSWAPRSPSCTLGILVPSR